MARQRAQAPKQPHSIHTWKSDDDITYIWVGACTCVHTYESVSVPWLSCSSMCLRVGQTGEQETGWWGKETEIQRLAQHVVPSVHKLIKRDKQKHKLSSTFRKRGWWGKLVGCVMSQQHASVSQEGIYADKFTCCHTEIEVADQTFHLTQLQYTDTSPSTDPTTPGAWQGSHWSANF